MCLKIFKRKEEQDMQYTDNLELNLPESSDYIEDDSREALNDNFEILDAQHPKRYVIRIDDFTNAGQTFLGGKCYFFNDGTYEAKITYYGFKPERIASGTTISAYSNIGAGLTAGYSTLPSDCPYVLSSLIECHMSVCPILLSCTVGGSSSNLQAQKLIWTLGGNNTSIVRMPRAGLISGTEIQVSTNGVYALINDNPSTATLTETDTNKYPRVVFTVRGTYTNAQ